MTQIKTILLNAIPILIMIGLIALIKNDYLLLFVDVIIIAIAFVIKHEPREWIIFAAALILLPIFEYIFVSTGAEIFLRRSLFGVMPIWLPMLWGYAFVAIKRVVLIL